MRKTIKHDPKNVITAGSGKLVQADSMNRLNENFYRTGALTRRPAACLQGERLYVQKN